MSKAVLLSIKPEYCDLIVKGLKTTEIRKKQPKLPLPFKCYIYKTNNGGVIGEFICWTIIQNHRDMRTSGLPKWKEVLTADDVFRSCLSFEEYEEYATNDRDLFAFCISELKIYDKPKEISEFHKYIAFLDGASTTELEELGVVDCGLKRPPQSWCYVEELV